MNTRCWAFAGLVMGACAGDGGPREGDCPEPPAVNIVCASVEDYGMVDFRVREANENAIRTGFESATGQRDGLNLALAEANPGEVAAGIFNCGDQPVHIDFRENVGTTEEVTWREDLSADGACFIRVDQAGVLGTDVIQGSFAATLRAGEDMQRAVVGSFHVGVGGNP